MSTMRRTLALAALCALALRAAAIIAWDTCEGKADHPSIKDGNYYNLCIMDEEFVDKSYTWTLTRSTIVNTLFDKCAFQNKQGVTSNFTDASWNDVTFKECRFGSYTEEPMIFDKTVFNNVVFDRCVFHKSVDMVWEQFAFNNVTFIDCEFQSDTLFQLGEMNDVSFLDSSFKRSPAAQTPSGKDSISFHQVTARNMLIKDSDFVTPLRFEGLAGADLAINDTSLREMWCHSEKNSDDKIRFYSAFNDTAFQAVTFKDNVYCDQTTWTEFFMGNVTFNRNADFYGSNVLGLYWDEVKMESPTRESLRLDFSSSQIEREVLANTTIKGVADFSGTTFKTVFVKNLLADSSDFKGAIFKDQEFIDGQCCSRVCRELKCMCDVSEPSGECPAGRKDVNVSAVELGGCFPAAATVTRHDGLIVRMEDIRLAEKIAIGGDKHSDVYFFGHRKSDHVSEFVSIAHVGSETRVRLSPNHYLYVDGKLRTAQSVRPGQRLRGADGRDSLAVVNVKREELRGLYAPTTMHGDLLVDGVVVSSYTSEIHPGLSHKLLYPLRLLYRNGFDSVVSRFTFLHERSWAGVPRALGLRRGPEALED